MDQLPEGPPNLGFAAEASPNFPIVSQIESRYLGPRLAPIANFDMLCQPGEHFFALSEEQDEVADRTNHKIHNESTTTIKFVSDRSDQESDQDPIFQHSSFNLDSEVSSGSSKPEIQSTNILHRTNHYSIGAFEQSNQGRKTSQSIVQPKHNMQVSFEFVTFNGPPIKNDPASRSKVKAHVMRQIHQRRRLAKDHRLPAGTFWVRDGSVPLCKSPNNSNSVGIESAHETALSNMFTSSFVNINPSCEYRPQPACFCVSIACEICGQSEIFSWPIEGALIYTPYNTLPADGFRGLSSNPFESFPIQVTHHMHKMLHHFFYVHCARTNPNIYGRDDLMPSNVYLVELAVSDPAAMYAIISQSAYHLSVLMIQGNSLDKYDETIKHANAYLFAAIKLLQAKFDNSKEALSTITVFITAMLTSSMGIVADEVALRAHHKGMIKMIELRGGIDTLPRLIAHHVSRIDSATAWMFQTKPSCKMYNSRVRDPASQEKILGPIANNNPFTHKRFEDFCWSPLRTIARDLFYLTCLLNLHHQDPNKIGVDEREYFEDTFAAIQHAMASYPHPKSILIKSTMVYRQECFRIAAFLYFNAGIRIAPSVKLLQTFTGRLIEALQESDLSSMWRPYSDILLWILFMGYNGALDLSEKGWFVQESKRVIKSLKLNGLDSIEKLMMELLYRKTMLHDQLRKLWAECSL